MTGEQLDLAIWHAPKRMRLHGYAEAHSMPLVSAGKNRKGIFQPAHRVPANEAWDWREVELRSGRAWPCLILDCDGTDGTQAFVDALMAGAVPEPNWMVTSRRSGGTHVVYNLKAPVLRGPTARRRPMKRFQRIAEYYTQATAADAGYNAVLSHNPMAKAAGAAAATTWGRRDAYTLEELGSVIPFGWRRPSAPRSAVGRNVALFETLMRWAGSAANAEVDVLAAAMTANEQFDEPLPASEVAGVARSVEKYREEWGATGWHRASFRKRQAARAARGRANVRKKTAERDARIVNMMEGGLSLRAVAGEFGLTQEAVRKVVQRDAPLTAAAGERTAAVQAERDDRASRWLEAYADGASIASMAKASGVTRWTVQRTLQPLLEAIEKAQALGWHESLNARSFGVPERVIKVIRAGLSR